jgi:hypothetical protein
MSKVEQIGTSYDYDEDIGEVVDLRGGGRDYWGLSTDTKARLAHEDVEGLAGLLNNGDWRVRLEGVRGLGILGDARSVVHLIRALQDEDSRVSGEARGILRVILERLTHPSFCC